MYARVFLLVRARKLQWVTCGTWSRSCWIGASKSVHLMAACKNGSRFHSLSCTRTWSFERPSCADIDFRVRGWRFVKGDCPFDMFVQILGTSNRKFWLISWFINWFFHDGLIWLLKNIISRHSISLHNISTRSANLLLIYWILLVQIKAESKLEKCWRSAEGRLITEDMNLRDLASVCARMKVFMKKEAHLFDTLDEYICKLPQRAHHFNDGSARMTNRYFECTCQLLGRHCL